MTARERAEILNGKVRDLAFDLTEAGMRTSDPGTAVGYVMYLVNLIADELGPDFVVGLEEALASEYPGGAI